MQPIDFDDLGSDLLAVMDAAGVARASYVGVSMGVPTGLAAHKMAEDRFAALVLCDGQARTAPGGAAGWIDRIAMAEASGMEAFAAATVDRWLTSGTGAERRQDLAKMIAATPLDGFRACATGLMDYDYADELARPYRSGIEKRPALCDRTAVAAQTRCGRVIDVTHLTGCHRTACRCVLSEP